jgi:hypothetical protein
MAASLKNLDNLIDEIRKASQTDVKDEYSAGYSDGLAMALSILEGLTD